MNTFLAAIDLSAVTDGVDEAQAAILLGTAAVITAGVGLMAVKFGGRWLVSVFKIFSK